MNAKPSHQVAIFGWAGTGKTSSGKLIAKELGFEFISTGNIFRNMAIKRGVTSQELEALAEADDSIDHEIDDFIMELGRTRSHILVESRLAHFFMPETAIRMKFYCTDDERFRRIAEREKKSINQAGRETREREKIITKRYEALYGITGFWKARHFNIVLNTTICPQELTVKKAVTEINALLASRT
jgi:cytidylate kinase